MEFCRVAEISFPLHEEQERRDRSRVEREKESLREGRRRGSWIEGGEGHGRALPSRKKEKEGRKEEKKEEKGGPPREREMGEFGERDMGEVLRRRHVRIWR